MIENVKPNPSKLQLKLEQQEDGNLNPEKKLDMMILELKNKEEG